MWRAWFCEIFFLFLAKVWVVFQLLFTFLAAMSSYMFYIKFKQITYKDFYICIYLII